MRTSPRARNIFILFGLNSLKIVKVLKRCFNFYIEGAEAWVEQLCAPVWYGHTVITWDVRHNATLIFYPLGWPKKASFGLPAMLNRHVLQHIQHAHNKITWSNQMQILSYLSMPLVARMEPLPSVNSLAFGGLPDSSYRAPFMKNHRGHLDRLYSLTNACDLPPSPRIYSLKSSHRKLILLEWRERGGRSFIFSPRM